MDAADQWHSFLFLHLHHEAPRLLLLRNPNRQHRHLFYFDGPNRGWHFGGSFVRCDSFKSVAIIHLSKLLSAI